MLEACVTVCNPQARLTWLSESFLHRNTRSEPWSEMPVWVEEKDLRLRHVQQCARHRRRAEVPLDQRDDPRHAGLGQDTARGITHGARD